MLRFRPVQLVVELRRKARIRRIPRLIGAGVRIIAGKRTIRGSLRPARVISQPSIFSGPNGKKIRSIGLQRLHRPAAATALILSADIGIIYAHACACNRRLRRGNKDPAYVRGWV